MTFHKTVATLALAGLSFGAARAQSDDTIDTPAHIISVFSNIKPHTADESGIRRGITGLAVEYAKPILYDPIWPGLHSELTWQVGAQMNRIHVRAGHTATAPMGYQGDVRIRQYKIVGGFGLGLRFRATDKLTVGARIQTDVGLNIGVVDGLEMWDTGDFCAHARHRIISPCLTSAPQLFIRHNRAEIFGGIQATGGIVKNKKLSNGQRVQNQVQYATNNQMNYLVGLRLYLKSRGK